MKNELIQVIEANQLGEQTGQLIESRFLPFFEQAKEWKSKAESLVITSAEQTKDMKKAREARLSLKRIRVDANKVRKELKADSLRYGKAVQGVYNVVEFLIVPIEKHLEAQEKFVQLQEEKKRDEIRMRREMELETVRDFVPYGIDLGELSQDDYIKLFDGAKLQKHAEKQRQRKIEEQRLAREKAEELERERIRKENEKLRKEAEELEKQIAAERKKAEEKQRAIEKRARKEREEAMARQKEIENKAKKEREEAAKKQRAIEEQMKEAAHAIEMKRKAAEKAEAEKREEERRAKAAPDKAKLIALADKIENLELPKLTGDEGQEILEDVGTLLQTVSDFIREKTKNL